MVARKLITQVLRPQRATTAPKNHPRASSLPFISGDTFRSVAGVLIESGAISVRGELDSGVIFADTQTAASSDFFSLLSQAIDMADSAPPRVLVIHNGDHNFELTQLEQLKPFGLKIFATNLTQEAPGISALPIGLENSFYDKNGRLEPFLQSFDNPSPPENRTRRVLSSFHEETNQSLRGPVKSVLSHSRFGHEEQFRRRPEYRQEVQNTKFVISPPGNGRDCHRTWEAIYLGAVPVVMNGHLAESLTSDLPICVVDDYEDFVSLTDNELDALYQELRSRPLTKAWGHHWLAQFFQ